MRRGRKEDEQEQMRKKEDVGGGRGGRRKWVSKVSREEGQTIKKNDLEEDGEE